MLDPTMDPTPAGAAAPTTPAPRYLRFVTALVLGAAVSTVPLALTGCDDDSPPADAAVDAPVDASQVVDGPLAPPDLPRALA